jgi:putative ABC transport system ATP-binding protein
MIIQALDLGKVYQKGKNSIEVIKEFNHVFESGKMYLLKGASGKGKTTLLSILGLLDKPTSGKLLLNGKEIDFTKPGVLCDIRKAEYSFVFQDYALFENLSVYENLRLVYEDTDEKLDEKRIDDLLLKMNLSHRKYHRTAELSGGEKQRVAFARALLKDAEVFIFDEPISNVDEGNAQIIFDIMKVLKTTRMVMVTCHTSVFDNICDEIVCL